MNLLSKETLIGAAALGGGVIAAKVVQKKVIPMIPVSALQSPAAQNIATLVLGIFTPVAIKGSIGKGLGAGMIATSVAGLVDPLLSKAGITGTDNVFMGDVFMGSPEAGSPVMGAESDIFDSPKHDYSSSSAGEMEY